MYIYESEKVLFLSCCYTPMRLTNVQSLFLTYFRFYNSFYFIIINLAFPADITYSISFNNLSVLKSLPENRILIFFISEAALLNDKIYTV